MTQPVDQYVQVADQTDPNTQQKYGAESQTGGGGPPGSGGPSATGIADLFKSPWFLGGVGLIAAATAIAIARNLRGT